MSLCLTRAPPPMPWPTLWRSSSSFMREPTSAASLLNLARAGAEDMQEDFRATSSRPL
jgi:hypothetical protein